MNIRQENQFVNSRSVGVLIAAPLGSVINGVSEGFFNDQMVAAGGLSSFPVGGEAEAPGGALQVGGADEGALSGADRVFRLNRADRLRSPGDDDGEPLPVGSPEWFGDDYFDVNFDGGPKVIEQPYLPYLDLYAWDRGVGENEEKSQSQEKSISEEYISEINRAHACRRSASFLSSDDFDDYFSPLDCRKAWCPVCGGKGGKVHGARKKAIYDRIDVERFNLRYFVFTVPERFRSKFMNRKGMNQLSRGVSRVVKKFFGEKKPAVAAFHLYGDEDKGKFNPHLNVIIPEEKSVKLKMAPADLSDLKDSWMRSLRGMGCIGIDVVDVFYEFRIKSAHKGHLIKYVTRPTWDAETLGMVDEAERWFLVLALKGFQYLRFWGELSNRCYRESFAQTIRESKKSAEDLIGKKLHFRGVFLVDVEKLFSQGKVERISENLFRIIKQKEKNRLRWVENEDSSGFRNVADG